MFIAARYIIVMTVITVLRYIPSRDSLPAAREILECDQFSSNIFNSVQCDEIPARLGVPQGSQLGPLLLIL